MNKVSYKPQKEKIGADEIFDFVFKDATTKYGLQEFSQGILSKIKAFEWWR